MRHALYTCIFGLATGFLTGEAQAEPLPEPLRAAAETLQQMGLEAECHAVSGEPAACRYRQPLPPSDASRWIEIRHLPEHRTLYLFVDEYLRARPDAPTTPALLRRVMELNWELLIPKLAWDPRTGAVRMSALLPSDNGAGSQALRSALQALHRAAGRYLPELRALAQTGDGSAP